MLQQSSRRWQMTSGGDTHLQRARRRLRERAAERAERLESLRIEAARDAEAVVQMIADKYRPARIYQWGSLLRPGGFREYSDIDIAVEGVADARTFFNILADAQQMCDLPLDLVEIEKIAPEYADEIREYGQVAYERD